MSRFVGFFAIMNKYPETMKLDIHCSHPILKQSDYWLIDGAFASLIFLKSILNKKNKICYRKYPFDSGIQVWSDMADTGSNMVDVEEALVTQISCASYPNYQLSQTDFLPCRHG